MQRRNFLLAMAGTAATLLAPSANAALPWIPIGSRKAGLLADHDTIHVRPWKIFRKLKLTVTGNGLFIYDVKVTYHNGSSEHLNIRWHIPQGGGTRQIDLNGGDRILRKVELIYGRLPNGRGAAHVHLFGQI